MRALTERAGLVSASVVLRQGGALDVRREGRTIVSEWTTRPRAAAPSAPPPRTRSVDDAVHAAEWFGVERPIPPPPAARAVHGKAGRILPLAYADTPIGELQLIGRTAGDAKGPPQPWLAGFARQLAFLIMRYEVEVWANRRLGASMRLVGMGRVLQDLETHLERAARTDLPVLLTGEFGTEKPQLAATIHYGSARRDQPFVEVNCAEPLGSPVEWFEKAAGGTVFLSGIDELPPALQRRLPLTMRSSLGQWLADAAAPDVRVIAASTADLRERVRDGRFSQALLAELDFLSIAAPPLRDRPEDMEALVAAAFERRGFSPADKRSDALLAACRAYAWPENLFELERVVARLAVMTDGRPIERDDILRHTPWIASAPPLRPRPQKATAFQEAPARPFEYAPSGGLDRWVHCALNKDTAELERLHDALRKALLYLGDHYAEPISLGQLARQAHVSQSHLSFLFRSALDTQFKTLLGRIRIHKAKEILATQMRRQITDVAMSVGFTDLSHFEKSFRRMVGQTPREFRRGRAGVDGAR
ncbi:helix-turn-helix domain-containing protein [Phreatobacter stygius]|uniref:Helix-turn-helix domain-containing protein n=2 Tax=Phreatobacter stygius TaxID=1940610 RepID=A0A4D7B8J4_9HYPH|nr:helix-turn-helix domain-containing protein [Phreatobacter stygius]